MIKIKKNLIKSTIKNNIKPQRLREKEYIIIYESEEHYEVLGYVRASSLEEAKKKAQEELLEEARYYNVTEAEIDEIANYDQIFFDLD